jgi:hypothetical protein
MDLPFPIVGPFVRILYKNTLLLRGAFISGTANFKVRSALIWVEPMIAENVLLQVVK